MVGVFGVQLGSQQIFFVLFLKITTETEGSNHNCESHWETRRFRTSVMADYNLGEKKNCLIGNWLEEHALQDYTGHFRVPPKDDQG